MANNVLTSIPNHFTTQFDANWKHLVQQKNSRLREYVTIDSIQGKEKSYNQLDTATMAVITDRSVTTRISDQSMAKRWVRTQEYDTAKLVDEWDEAKLGEVVLPTSPIVQAHGNAYARTCDSVIISALQGDSYTGNTGTTAVSLPSSQKVGVQYVESGTAANSGLTIAKLRRAKFILDANEVDEEEERIIVMDPPAYGHGPNGESWVLEKQINELVGKAVALLDESEAFLLVNTYSLGFSSVLMYNLMRQHALAGDAIETSELCLEDGFGKLLPLGVVTTLKRGQKP